MPFARSSTIGDIVDEEAMEKERGHGETSTIKEPKP